MPVSVTDHNTTSTCQYQSQTISSTYRYQSKNHNTTFMCQCQVLQTITLHLHTGINHKPLHYIYIPVSVTDHNTDHYIDISSCEPKSQQEDDKTNRRNNTFNKCANSHQETNRWQKVLKRVMIPRLFICNKYM